MGSFLTFKLTGTKAAVKTFKKTESNILIELKRIVEEIFLTQILTDAKENVTKQLGQQSGTLRSNIKVDTRILGKAVIGRIFVDLKRVPYARIHELGGVALPTVTAKSKKFFWFKFFESGETSVFWRRMALQKVGKVMVVKIPRRSYLRPAIEKNIPLLRKTIKKEMNKLDLKEKK